MKFIPYILKTLWWHRSRTILTVSGSAVALFVFCFVGAVQEGMDDLQRRQAAKGSLIAFQANKFCPAASHLPQDYDQQIARLEGVREVFPVQVFTNNCRASLDVVVQTIGFSGPRVFRLVMTESVLLSIAGGIVGVGAAMLMLELSSLSVGAEAVTIAFTPSIRLAVTGLAVSVIAGSLAGIAPAFHAARTDIVPALRQA